LALFKISVKRIDGIPRQQSTNNDIIMLISDLAPSQQQSKIRSWDQEGNGGITLLKKEKPVLLKCCSFFFAVHHLFR
jgi:hypothetical protein